MYFFQLMLRRFLEKSRHVAESIKQIGQPWAGKPQIFFKTGNDRIAGGVAVRFF